MTSHLPARLRFLVLILAMAMLGCGDDWLEEGWLEEEDAGQTEQAAVEPTDTVDSTVVPIELGAFTFAEDDCPFEVEIDLDIDCGFLHVPESRTGLSQQTIELAVAILRTPAPTPADDAVVFLQGGPGGVSLAEHWSWLSELDDWREHPILSQRDLVLVDQRGTGYSLPLLACDDDGGETPDDCYQRLVDDGISVASYSTPENAADLAALRLALGYDEWNLYGSSYGTRLALAIVRDYPDGVRSMLLDGVYPPNTVPSYESFIDNALNALGALNATCAAQSACQQAYGDLNVLLSDTLTTLDEAPSAPYDAYEFIDYVFEAMYSVDTAADIPLALTLVNAGRYAEAIDVLDGSGAGMFRGDPTADSSGMYHAIECREEHAFSDLDAVEARFDELYSEGVNELLLGGLYGAVWGPAETICPTWEVGEADPSEYAAVTSDVPALVLSGVLDPITPPAWGALAAASLPNATHIVTPLSHSTVLEDACIDAIVRAFLDDPAGPVDTSCVSGIDPPQFTLP